MERLRQNSELQEREDRDSELVPPFKVLKLYYEGALEDLALHLLYEVNDRLRCAACCQQVVRYHDLLPRHYGVLVYLEGVRAVLEGVARLGGLGRELPRLSYEYHPGAELIGEEVGRAHV